MRRFYTLTGVFSFLFLFAGLLATLRSGAAEKAPAEGATSLPLTISTNDPYNLFYIDSLSPGQPITLSIETENRTGKPGAIEYRWRLTDYRGDTVRFDRFRGQPVGAGETDRLFLSFHRDADLKDRTGIYRFEITAEKGRDKAEAKTAFGVIPRPASGLRERSMFGVATESVDSQTLGALQRIGARWLRTDAGVNWRSVEKAKGEYDWDRFDRLATETRAHDIHLLPVLGDAPEWAMPKNPDGKPFQPVDAPEKVQDHADFVAAAVARYAKEIKYWENWNEPYVMGRTWRNSAQHYRDMLKADYEAAKKANPEAVLLASGANASHLQDVVFHPGANMKDYLDEVSVHAYGPGSPEEDFFGKAERAALLARQNGKKRVWITEQGWAPGNADQLAQYIPRAYALAAMAGASHLDWSTLADERMGLYRSDYTPKAAAVAYAVAASFLEDTMFVRDLWPHSRKIYGGVFKNPAGRKVAVVWAVGDKGSLTVSNAKDVQAYDLMGAPVGRRDGGKLEVPFGEDVVYLTSSADQAVFLDQLQSARVEGINPVEMVIKPFLTPISRTPPIRVQLTNVLNRPIEGDLKADPPKGWKLAEEKVAFGPLEPGRTVTVEIPVRQSTVSDENAYPVTVSAESRHRGVKSFLVRITGPDWRLRKSQTLSLAGATARTPIIDGDLADWDEALPLTMKSKEYLSPWGPDGWAQSWTPGNLSATLFTQYDDANLYIAAKVADNVHSGLSATDNPYRLPYEGDSLQLAFWSPEVVDTTKPKSPTGPNANRGVLFDTDYEFSLALTPKGPEVFRLRTPQSGPTSPYPTNPDAGLGLTDAIKLTVKRDDINEVTTYEAAIPWTELRELLKDKPFRFAVKLNDRDRENRLEGWMESAAGAGETRGNSLSFSPAWGYTTANLSDWILLPQGE